MNNNCIILFVKAPIPGLVKTRLAADIGDRKACDLYQKMTKKIIQTCIKTEAELEIHYYPENEVELIQSWLGPDFTLFPQRGNSLGDKMANAVASTLKKGYEKVILTGSDIPEISTDILVTGFQQIENNPVLGPCEDGGYYLIGFDRFSFKPECFKDIRWSTQDVLKETVQRMAECTLTPFLLPVLNDIDTKEDLDKLLGNNSCSDTGSEL